MSHVEYDATRESLYHPGNASDFFQLGPHADWGNEGDDAALCAEMSRLAYVKDESLVVRYLARAGFQEVLALGYGSGGTQLFIAKKQDANLFVVAFRGTEPDDPSDLFTDADFRQVSWAFEKNPPMGKVHKGFADALLYGDNGNNILNKVVGRLGTSMPEKRVLLTGHSLGAALATLAASWMPDASLYTFGSPRVGDNDFAEYMNRVKHARYVDCCDLVTRVPPDKFMGYKHTGALHYITQGGEVKLLQNDDDPIIESDRDSAAKKYLVDYALFPGTVWVRELADHAPINYVSGVMGLR